MSFLQKGQILTVLQQLLKIGTLQARHSHKRSKRGGIKPLSQQEASIKKNQLGFQRQKCGWTFSHPAENPNSSGFPW